ncbi:glutaminyl-peptide cyclotransferase [Fusarium mundagurra]|uniref:Peptide hydrolase n=1 Tax=Fusarium mundagurra TaxID=1567541 RepID=A0A8H5Y830_9HYPO|nr:glutaminyl-peptide cyclotransferase [Fusarium mundagurra]
MTRNALPTAEQCNQYQFKNLLGVKGTLSIELSVQNSILRFVLLHFCRSHFKRPFTSLYLDIFMSSQAVPKMASPAIQQQDNSAKMGKPTNPPERDAGVVITQVGLLTNIVMAAIKGVYGYSVNSKTMLADAIHGATDAMSDTLALAAITWGSRPPTSQFPYGHGKIESLGALGVSAILLVGSLSMGFNSFYFLLVPFLQGKQQGLVNQEAAVGTFVYAGGGLLSHIFAIGISLATIAAKEWLYSATMKLATECKSTVLESNALHHRVDSFTEVVIICVILTSKLFRHVAWLDPVGGLFISLMAVRPATEFTASALRELVDYSIEEEVKEDIYLCSEDILEEIDSSGKVVVTSVTGIRSGQRNLINLEMAMPNRWTIDEASELEIKFCTELEKRTQNVCHARIHVRPVEAKKEIRLALSLSLIFITLGSSSGYKTLYDETLRKMPPGEASLDIHSELLAPILIPRVSGTDGSSVVQHHFIQYFNKHLPEWTIQWQNSSAKTPLGNSKVHFSNLIFRRRPPGVEDASVSWLTLAAHYDSKISPVGFIGATDSAVPCAVLLQMARNIEGALQAKWGKDPGEIKNGNEEIIDGIQILLLDGEEAFLEWTEEDSLYGSRSLAQEWDLPRSPTSAFRTNVDSISLFVLLDLLGAAEPTIASHFLTTHWVYERAADIEHRMRNLKLLETQPRKMFFLEKHKPADRFTESPIQDDHIPFIRRGVHVLHIIPTPFPAVWHTMQDNAENLDMPTVRDWIRIMSALVMEWMEVGDLYI